MYEYIPNQIIEGTLKALIITVKYVFFISSDIWSYANEFYFNEDDDEETQPTCPLSFLLGVDTDPEEYAWEYDFKELLSNLCDNFFTYFYTDKDNNNQNTKPSQASSDKKNPVDYVDKYRDEWKNRLLSNTVKQKEEIDVDSLKKNVLIENTPFGNVIMYYDSVKNTFVYYSDKTLSYPIVNTVGRKYVLTFGCESLYVDETNQNNNTNSSTESNSNTSSSNAPSSTDSSQEEQKKNVYAKFKNYKKPKTNTSSTSNSVKKEDVKDEQINRYTCEGKLSNFSFLQKVQKVKPFSYKDFKNKFKST
jgi:hypothetical protein